MRNDLILIFGGLFLLLTASCGSADIKTTEENLPVCTENKMMDHYFSDWKSSVECANEIVKVSKDIHALQKSYFILGENYYLKGDSEKAFSSLIRAVKGPMSSIAAASLYYIRDLDLSFENMEHLAKVNTSTIEDIYTKYLVENEKRKWALIIGELEEFDEMSLKFNLLKKALIVKGNSTVELDNLKDRPQIKAEISYPSDALNVFNYVKVEPADSYFIIYDFSIEKNAVLPILFQTDSKIEMYLNGVQIFRHTEGQTAFATLQNGGLYQFSKGSYRLIVKLSPTDIEHASIKVFLPHHSERIAQDITGSGTGKSVKYDVAVVKLENNFLKYVSLLASEVSGALSEDDYYGFYSKIIGSKNPSVLFFGANFFNGKAENTKAEKLLKSIAALYPELVKPSVMLMNILVEQGRDDEFQKMMTDLPEMFKNTMGYRLFIADLYSKKEQYASGLKYSEDTYRKFRDNFSANLYYSIAIEEFGNLQFALKTRLRLLKSVPNHYPLMENILTLSEKVEDLQMQRTIIRKMLKIAPDNLKLKLKLARTHLLSRKLAISEEMFLEILLQDPENTESFVGLGDIAVLKNDVKNAAKYYKKASIIDPEDKEASKRNYFFEDIDSNEFFEKFSLEEEKIEVLLKNAAISSENPYEILYDEGVQKVIDRKNIKSRYRMVIRINNPDGAAKFSKFPIAGELISARIIKSDGTISDKYFQKDGHVVFVSLSSGDIIDVKYSAKETAGHWLQGFNSSWLFGEEGVVNRRSSLTVYIPESIPVNFSIRGDVKRNSSQYKGGTVHTFQTENIFIHTFEPLMPRDTNDFLPGVEYSLVTSWEEFAKWQIGHIKDSSATGDELNSISEKIRDSILSKEQAVETLRDFVAKKVRYSFDIPGILSVKPEPAESVLKRMSGDCKDKALLLKLMLEHAGINSRYSLIRSNDYGELNKQTPYMQFDYALVYVPVQNGIEKDFFIDPASEYDHFLGINHLYEDTEAMVFDEIKERFDFIKVKNIENSSVEVMIDNAGLSTLTLKGWAASIVRLSVYTGQKLETVIADMIKEFVSENVSVEEASVEKDIFSEPLKINFKSPKIVPAPIKTVFSKLMGQDSRIYPIDLSSIPSEVTFTLNSNVLKKELEIESPFLNYKVQQSVGNGIKITLKVKKNIIAPEEFAELKKTVITIIEFENKLTEE